MATVQSHEQLSLTVHRRHVLTGHRDRVWSVAFTQLPDGRRVLASGSQDGTAIIWDACDGDRGAHLTGHTDWIWSVAWSVARSAGLTSGLTSTPLLATASGDNSVQIWDPVTGNRLGRLVGHPAGVESVAWGEGPDGSQLLATGGSFDSSAAVWSPAGGARVASLGTGAGAVTAVAWGSGDDGRPRLAVADDDGGIHIWDLRHREPPQYLPGHDATLLGRRGEAAGPAPAVEPSANQVACLAWTRRGDGSPLLAAGYYDGTVVLWDPVSGARLRTLAAHLGIVWSVAWVAAPDGPLLLGTGGQDSTAAIWDPMTGARLACIEHPGDVNDVDFGTGPGESVLFATACDDHAARIYDVTLGSACDRITIPGQVTPAAREVGPRGVSRRKCPGARA